MQDVSVLIGRFQADTVLHKGHEALLNMASEDCDQLILLLGSANAARSILNPWTYNERKLKISEWAMKHNRGLIIAPLNDYKYSNTQWCSDVVETTKMLTVSGNDIRLVGHDKPGNNYLKMFPQWGDYQDYNSGIQLDATSLREDALRNRPASMPTSVLEDWLYFQKEKAQFANYPYPETLNFACADAIIECAGHVLLILRGRAPGKGTWALPGGFKENNETYLDCIIREVCEEANLRIPEKVLRGSMVRRKMYDDPTRGCGIPRHTMAHLFRIEPDPDGNPPRVTPGDDAVSAVWVPIPDVLNNYVLFDDHLHIIQDMTAAASIMAIYNKRFYLTQP